MKRLALAAILAIIFIASGRMHAQEFTASVDNNQVAVGDQFTVTFSLTGSSGGENFRPPSFNDFMVAGGPNQSTNMSFNGRSVTQSISYSYVLQPKAEGKFTLGAASIDYNGKQLHTQPIAITVSKGAARPKQGGAAPGGATGDIGRQIGDNLFLNPVVSKSNVYQGEQIIVTYKIYTRVSVVNMQLPKAPAFTGFWSENLSIPKDAPPTTETINGKQYRVGLIQKVALFPQRSGVLQLDPMQVDCIVQVQQKRQFNNPFDQFFNDPFFGGAQNVKYSVRSEPVKITVQALPTANPADGFSGAVGKFTMESWLDKQQTKTNEPVTLKIKIIGRGNLKLLEAPQINFPSDFEKYDPKMSDNITTDANGVSGSRTFEYLLIPRHPGEQKIPSFAFSSFDVEKKQYVTTHSREFVVSVERGNELPSSTASGISKEDVKLLGEDIRFIKSGNTVLHRQGDRLAGSTIFYAATVTPFLAFIGFLVFMRKRERALGDVRSVRNRRARKVAQKRLEESKKCLQAKKREEFYAAISRSLWGYASDKLNIPASDLTLDNIESGFRDRAVAPEMLEKLRKTVEECEFARFAPSSGIEQMDAMYTETVNLISGIEETIR